MFGRFVLGLFYWLLFWVFVVCCILLSCLCGLLFAACLGFFGCCVIMLVYFVLALLVCFGCLLLFA